MKKNRIFIAALCWMFSGAAFSQSAKTIKSKDGTMLYQMALVDFDAYKELVKEVEKHRAERLISLDTFLKMSKEKNVVIFDSRSDFRFNRKHLKGAIHLDFTDYTQENLAKLLPDSSVKILIYCNNNFDGDPVDFSTKVANPNFNLKNDRETQILSNRKPIMLALNIPTYINLYGYGYRNIYELNELVNVSDKRIQFEGSTVK